ncbi:hypothetical protein N7462_010706 [Penicillium macrosclerotiorum]|uniref:uncharacterized protein n=1 Tax=Penicillium macrosclerotiorum TaxID=303699 RepID=UPI0025470722|nr:uncharacterized protein N7462_010706 [Penicillium macrosclerotiorum]KAJ5669636.1 hypothetical protein N7462_010706 [Penicillium macrosclerotiorum]
MRSKATSVKPSAYPALPFHGIRFVTFLSAAVVGIILAVFIYHLHADGYKLPFAFLILLLAAVLSILNNILTAVINCACGLSTKLSIALNILLLILWALSLALLSYNMSGTILTKCTTTYWATSTALSVCRCYKALFAFTVVGVASYIAALWLDFVVRRRHNRLGAYNPMGSTPGLGDDAFDVKLADRHDPVAGAHYDNIPGTNHVDPYAHAGEAQQYYDAAPPRTRGPGHVRFDSYASEHTAYDPAGHR